MVAQQVRKELKELGVVEMAPGLAAVAVRLATALDKIPADEAPTSQAVLADKLTAVMVKLRGLAPGTVKGDAVDDIAEQRKKRRAAARESASGE